MSRVLKGANHEQRRKDFGDAWASRWKIGQYGYQVDRTGRTADPVGGDCRWTAGDCRRTAGDCRWTAGDYRWTAGDCRRTGESCRGAEDHTGCAGQTVDPAGGDCRGAGCPFPEVRRPS